MTTNLAIVILAHSDLAHLQHLLRRLAPLHTFVHIDARAPASFVNAVSVSAPADTVFLDRQPTPWASLGLVQAELRGIAAALTDPATSHVAVLSGTCYPLLPASGLCAATAALGQRSRVVLFPLPFSGWGRHGGLDRYTRLHWNVARRDLWVPTRRQLPLGLSPAGGQQQKILSRTHATALLAALGNRPDILDFWRHVWVPDETLIPSCLSSPDFLGPSIPEVITDSAWFTDWRGPKLTGPRWIEESHIPWIKAEQAERARNGSPLLLFCRKLSLARFPNVVHLLDSDLPG